jgi:hypothetical protein
VVAALVETLAASPEERAQWRHAWTECQLEADERAAVSPRGDAEAVAAARVGRILPRQLPPAISYFTGRTEQLDHLEELSTRAVHGYGPRGATVAAVISGAPGIGKTALALQWAHTVADRFPDGQLHLDLRGSMPSSAGPGYLSAPAAVSTLLPGLLGHRTQIPTDPAALLALYRSRMAGTRTLVLVDGAVDADQVRPLLPGSSHCLVVVTSRSPLTDLIAVDGAEPVPLGPLTDHEAHDLLARRLGNARRKLDGRSAAALVDLSGCMPLALNRLIAQALLLGDLPPHELLAALGADSVL